MEMEIFGPGKGFFFSQEKSRNLFVFLLFYFRRGAMNCASATTICKWASELETID